MSSPPSSEFIEAMEPSPNPSSVPSGAFSLSPLPPPWFSWRNASTPPPPSRGNTVSLPSPTTYNFVSPSLSPPSVPSEAFSPKPSPPSQATRVLVGGSLPHTPNPPSQAIQMLVGDSLPHTPSPPSQAIYRDSEPNVSSKRAPQPSQLNRALIAPGCGKFYAVTTGWEVGIFGVWYGTSLGTTSGF
jgi:hypothetical protein